MRQEGQQYSGQWADDKREGKGRQQYADLSVYEGDFCDDKREGEGREIKPNGDLYIGSWKNDMKVRSKQTKGTLTCAASITSSKLLTSPLSLLSTILYSAGFKQHGEGLVKFYRIMKKYKGVWVNNVPKCGEYKVLRERNPNGLHKGETKSEDSDEEVPEIPQLTLRDSSKVLQEARNSTWKAVLSEM